MALRFGIGKIRLHKDELVGPNGDFGPGEFWQAKDKVAEVREFKRVEVEATFEGAPFKLIMDARANAIRVVAKNVERQAQELMHWIQRAVNRWDVTGQQARVVMTVNDQGKGTAVFAVPDVMWWAGVLHELRLATGGFEIVSNEVGHYSMPPNP